MMFITESIQQGFPNTYGRKILLAIYFLCLPFLSFANAYTHEKTGLVFEDKVDDLVKTQVKNYETTKAGLGISVDYRGNGKKLTIYVYNLREKSISSDLYNPFVIDNFRSAINEVFEMYRSVEMKDPVPVPYKGKFAQSNWLMSVFEIHDNGRAQNSYLMCTTYKNFFVKLRYTYDNKHKASAEPTGGRAFEYIADQFK